MHSFLCCCRIIKSWTYFIVGAIIVSYSVWVASCSKVITGCKTAASTSPLLISACNMGQTFCHHNFWNEKNIFIRLFMCVHLDVIHKQLLITYSLQKNTTYMSLIYEKLYESWFKAQSKLIYALGCCVNFDSFFHLKKALIAKILSVLWLASVNTSYLNDTKLKIVFLCGEESRSSSLIVMYTGIFYFFIIFTSRRCLSKLTQPSNIMENQFNKLCTHLHLWEGRKKRNTYFKKVCNVL